jgi:hypothetical protein
MGKPALEVSTVKAQLTVAHARKGHADPDWERAQRRITNGAIAKRGFDQKKNEAKETDKGHVDVTPTRIRPVTMSVRRLDKSTKQGDLPSRLRHRSTLNLGQI